MIKRKDHKRRYIALNAQKRGLQLVILQNKHNVSCIQFLSKNYPLDGF